MVLGGMLDLAEAMDTPKRRDVWFSGLLAVHIEHGEMRTTRQPIPE